MFGVHPFGYFVFPLVPVMEKGKSETVISTGLVDMFPCSLCSISFGGYGATLSRTDSHSYHVLFEGCRVEKLGR